jgi:hypothetical protein
MRRPTIPCPRGNDEGARDRSSKIGRNHLPPMRETDPSQEQEQMNDGKHSEYSAKYERYAIHFYAPRTPASISRTFDRSVHV